MADRAQQLASLDDCIAVLEQELVDIERGTKDANLNALASYAVPKEYVELCRSCTFPPLPHLTPLPATELSSTRGGGRRAAVVTQLDVVSGKSEAAPPQKSRAPKRGRESLGDSNAAKNELPEPAAKLRKPDVQASVVTTSNVTTEEASPRGGGRRGRIDDSKKEVESEELVAAAEKEVPKKVLTGRRGGKRATEKEELPIKEQGEGDKKSADTNVSTRKKKEEPEQVREKEKGKEEAAEDKGNEQRGVRGRRKSEPETESPVASSGRASNRRISGPASAPIAPPPPQPAAAPVAPPVRRTRGKDDEPVPEPDTKASSPRGGTRTATKAAAAAKEEEGRRTRGSTR